MSQLNRRRGKDAERAVARLLNGLRVGILGKADVLTDRFCIEVKERKILPSFLVKAYGQAEKNTSDGKIPILIIHQLNQNHDEDLVTIKLKNFLRLIRGRKNGL